MAIPRISRTIVVFGVLRDRQLRAMWLSMWVSDVGNFVTSIALVVYVSELTGSATSVGLALALGSIPWVTLGPFAGVLADRLDRRKLLVWTNLARAAFIGALPFTNAVWQAYALALASFLISPVQRPARSALLAAIAPEGRLVPALAVIETTHELLHTVGPAIGGLVVLVAGARNAFFVDAASFVLAAAFVTVISPQARVPPSAGRSARRELVEGFRAVFGQPAVRTYTLLDSALYLAFSGITALLVVYVREFLGRSGGEYGLILSVAGLGTVLVSLMVAARDEHRPRTPWALVSPFGLAAFVLVAWEPSYLSLLPIAFLAGFGEGAVVIPATATVAEALPDDVRGRAYGTASAVNELAAAIGALGFAWLGESARLGPANGMALAGGVGCALGLLVLAAGGAKAIRLSEATRMAMLRERPAPRSEPRS